MRKTIVLSLAILAASAGAAFGQQQPEDDGEIGAPAPPRRERPFVPPTAARCPDLALSSYEYVTAVPGGEPLAEDEIALRWAIHNGGNTAYASAGADTQSLALEYVSAAGTRIIAATPIPQQAEGEVSLNQGGAWRGYLRTHITAAERRRVLRLNIRYAGDGRTPPNDCDTTNNQVVITPPLAAVSVPTSAPAAD